MSWCAVKNLLPREKENAKMDYHMLILYGDYTYHSLWWQQAQPLYIPFTHTSTDSTQGGKGIVLLHHQNRTWLKTIMTEENTHFITTHRGFKETVNSNMVPAKWNCALRGHVADFVLLHVFVHAKVAIGDQFNSIRPVSIRTHRNRPQPTVAFLTRFETGQHSERQVCTFRMSISCSTNIKEWKEETTSNGMS